MTTTMDTDAALRNLSQFVNIMQPLGLQQSPEKLSGLEDMLQVVSGMPQFVGIPDLTVPEPASKITVAASSSSGSVSPREENLDEGETADATRPANPRPYRLEQWHECFQTTKESEFQALIYSVYVMQRDSKPQDGYYFYDCINRLQSKCRYKIRTKRQDEFYVIEEKGAHNHAMEPVGSPGSHAGLPKTLREIVDLSFKEDWPNMLRQQKIEEEVKRLGLPHNPRLGRQVDNRIAYLRRVKNLEVSRKIQSQMSNDSPMASILPNGANSEDFLKLMMQMANNGIQLQESPQKAPIESIPMAPIVMPSPQMEVDQALPQNVQLPQINIQDNHEELMQALLQQKEGGPDQHILNILMNQGLIPSAPAVQVPPAQVPMEQDSSSSSSPEGRLEIDD